MLILRFAALAAAGTPASAQTRTLCGFEVGPQLLQGVVGAEHDGDTLTAHGTTVRLASIDAAVPICSSNSPLWSGNTTLPATPTYTVPPIPVTVNGYYRSNGPYVQAYTRKARLAPDAAVRDTRLW